MTHIRQQKPNAHRPHQNERNAYLGERLDHASDLADLARAELNKAMPALTAATPQWVRDALWRAAGHLSSAAVLIDRVADSVDPAVVITDQLDADQAVGAVPTFVSRAGR